MKVFRDHGWLKVSMFWKESNFSITHFLACSFVEIFLFWYGSVNWIKSVLPDILMQRTNLFVQHFNSLNFKFVFFVSGRLMQKNQLSAKIFKLNEIEISSRVDIKFNPTFIIFFYFHWLEFNSHNQNRFQNHLANNSHKSETNWSSHVCTISQQQGISQFNFQLISFQHSCCLYGTVYGFSIEEA